MKTDLVFVILMLSNINLNVDLSLHECFSYGEKFRMALPLSIPKL